MIHLKCFVRKRVDILLFNNMFCQKGIDKMQY